MLADDAATPVTESHSLARRRLPDVLALVWFVTVGMVALLPTLKHGVFLGSFDALSRLGLSKRPGVVPHGLELGDQIDAMIPWVSQVWTQVHHGSLPLWNPYNGVGLPLAFNWQSAPFSLPVVASYLVPLRYAFDTVVIVTLVLAGTGVYTFCRLLGITPVAALFAGTVFELSGSLSAWLGFPHGVVMAWGGWLFAATLLVLRGRRRATSITFFAIVLAATIYAGQPEVLVVFVISLALFALVVVGARFVREPGSTSARPLIDLTIAALAGVALGAPLALPGYQVVAQSVRNGTGTSQALPIHNLMWFVTQGYDGLRIRGSIPLVANVLFYPQYAAYIGIIAFVLGVLGVLMFSHRIEVRALLVVIGAAFLVLFVPWVVHVMNHIPVFGTAAWLRALMPFTLGIAVLGGYGVDALVRSAADRKVRRVLAAGFGISGFLTVIVYANARGSLKTVAWNQRLDTIWGLAIGIIAGLAVTGCLYIAYGRESEYAKQVPYRLVGIASAVLLIIVESGFLISAGAATLSSSSSSYTPTAADLKLQAIVGSARVGFGGGKCTTVGIDPSVNSMLSVHELDAYDPVIPKWYFSSWVAVTGQSAGIPSFNLYCPRITTVEQARLYGIEYVLEPTRSTPGPVGSAFVDNVGDEALYRVADAFPATLSALSASGQIPSIRTSGSQVPVSQANPANWTMHTDSTSAGVLRLRLADFPGWNATVDGRPVRLRKFAGAMMQLKVPAGRHTVEVNYWPSTFSLGIAIASLTACILIVSLVIELRRRRKGPAERSIE